MKAETADQPKGFKSILKRANSSLFAPKDVPGRNDIAVAKANVDLFLSDLDTLLARSKAAQRKRALEQ